MNQAALRKSSEMALSQPPPTQPRAVINVNGTVCPCPPHTEISLHRKHQTALLTALGSASLLLTCAQQIKGQSR